MISDRLKRQISFISEIERLKLVYRQNGVLDGSRRENSAEHSWHIAVMALLLEEYSPERVNILTVIKMLLVHDMVEIYAGDTFLYDTQARENAKTTEREAAERVFSLLPTEQGTDFHNAWLEFEERETPEAKYAAVLDNFQPILNHYYTNNQNIKGKRLHKAQIIEKKSFIKDFSPELWEFALFIIEESVKNELYLD